MENSINYRNLKLPTLQLYLIGLEKNKKGMKEKDVDKHRGKRIRTNVESRILNNATTARDKNYESTDKQFYF